MRYTTYTRINGRIVRKNIHPPLRVMLAARREAYRLINPYK